MRRRWRRLRRSLSRIGEYAPEVGSSPLLIQGNRSVFMWYMWVSIDSFPEFKRLTLTYQ